MIHEYLHHAYNETVVSPQDNDCQSLVRRPFCHFSSRFCSFSFFFFDILNGLLEIGRVKAFVAKTKFHVRKNALCSFASSTRVYVALKHGWFTPPQANSQLMSREVSSGELWIPLPNKLFLCVYPMQKVDTKF